LVFFLFHSSLAFEPVSIPIDLGIQPCFHSINELGIGIGPCFHSIRAWHSHIFPFHLILVASWISIRPISIPFNLGIQSTSSVLSPHCICAYHSFPSLLVVKPFYIRCAPFYSTIYRTLRVGTKGKQGGKDNKEAISSIGAAEGRKNECGMSSTENIMLNLSSIFFLIIWIRALFI